MNNFYKNVVVDLYETACELIQSETIFIVNIL